VEQTPPRGGGLFLKKLLIPLFWVVTQKAPGQKAGAFWVCVVCVAKVLERDKRGIGLGGWSRSDSFLNL
uniref:hypothetical protein n=1 Tax=uncultured Flavonifractor sp. TaxID=1193534 RepID=UPI00261E41A9